MRTLLVVLAVAVMFLCGCTVVTPADRVVIHQNYLNAKATDAKVQAVEMPTPEQWAAVKLWWDADLRCWLWLDDWANGRAPTPTPVPPAK